MIPENLLKKLQALINLRDNQGATQAEAENAAARIQDLLLKHNLEMFDVQAALDGKAQQDEASNQVGDVVINLDEFQDKNGADWAFRLLHVVCRHNLCGVLRRKGAIGVKTSAGIIIGKAINIEIVVYGFTQLVTKIKAAEKWGWKNYTGTITNRNTYKRGFYMGCVHGIDAKLKAQAESLTQQSSDGKMTALVLYNSKQVENYIEQNFTVKAGRPSRGLSGRDGYYDGLQAARGMNINKGITSNSPKGHIGGS